MTIDVRSLSAALLLAAAFATPVLAAPAAYVATLSGGAEVPPTGEPGTGSVSATYDAATHVLTWKGTYAGLTGAVKAAHFHGPAAAGTNAGVAVPVDAAASPFQGSATLTDAQAADLAAGRLYFNLHTAAHPGGEVRGQVTPAP